MSANQTTRYPKLPSNGRRRKYTSKYSKKLVDDAERLYAEIIEGEAVLLLRLPGWQNAERVMESALAALVKLSMGESAEYALKACAMLLEFSNRQMERAGKQIEGSSVMAQLEQLYRKALPVEAESGPLVVEERDGG